MRAWGDDEFGILLDGTVGRAGRPDRRQRALPGHPQLPLQLGRQYAHRGAASIRAVEINRNMDSVAAVLSAMDIAPVPTAAKESGRNR